MLVLRRSTDCPSKTVGGFLGNVSDVDVLAIGD